MKVNKLADRAALFPFKAHTGFGTPMKNNWMMVWYVLTKKSPVIMKTMSCIVETDNGKMAYTRDNSQDKMLSFSPHFFSRYAERAGVNLTGTALIKHFFLNNLKFEYMGRLIPDEDGNTQKTEVYIRCDSGVGIGYKMISKAKKLHLNSKNEIKRNNKNECPPSSGLSMHASFFIPVRKALLLVKADST